MGQDDKYTEITLYILGIIFFTIRWLQSKGQTEEVKENTNKVGNSTIIHVDDAKDSVLKQIKDMDSKIDSVVASQFETNARLFERLDAHDTSLDLNTRMVQKLCAKVGVAWEKDVTVVTEPKPKE